MNEQLRNVTKKSGAFPGPDAVRKVLCLATAEGEGPMDPAPQNWLSALNHFALVFADRVPA